jgi:hypothetical protein
MSEIKVNKVSPRSGTTVTVGDGAGETVTVDAATVNLGRCGGTVALACGATQTGFGRTGTVNWCTTAKTGPLTAVSGNGYFINTTSGIITVTLPASPTAGDIIALKDYANTWDSNAVTLGRNSSKINGQCYDAILNTEAESVTMIYVDGTKGWQSVQGGTTDVTGAGYICASGGDATLTCGDYKTHVFTGDGTFTVNSLGSPTANTLDYLVVAGGGAGGGQGSGAGGGGAGGFRLSNALSLPAPTTSPLANPTGITATAAAYPITVGGGGAGSSCSTGADGSDSIFSTITSAGGGGGGSYANPGDPGEPGGSGGGGGNTAGGSAPGGSGNSPSVNPAQGTDGGQGDGGIGPGSNPNHRQGGGGGGGSTAGTDAGPGTSGAPGGDGSYFADAGFGPTAPSYGTPGTVTNTRYFAGGGGGGVQGGSGPVMGTGGEGGGGNGANPSPTQAVAGTVNTGGGGGGIVSNPTGFGGGSGIVLVRYKFQ